MPILLPLLLEAKPKVVAIIDPVTWRAWDATGRSVRNPLSPHLTNLAKHYVPIVDPVSPLVGRLLVVSTGRSDGALEFVFPSSPDFEETNGGRSLGYEPVVDGNHNTGIFAFRVRRDRRSIRLALQYVSTEEAPLVDLVWREGKTLVREGDRYRVKVKAVPLGSAAGVGKPSRPLLAGTPSVGSAIVVSHDNLNDGGYTVHQRAWDIHGKELSPAQGHTDGGRTTTMYRIDPSRFARYRISRRGRFSLVLPSVSMIARK